MCFFKGRGRKKGEIVRTMHEIARNFVMLQAGVTIGEGHEAIPPVGRCWTPVVEG